LPDKQLSLIIDKILESLLKIFPPLQMGKESTFSISPITLHPIFLLFPVVIGKVEVFPANFALKEFPYSIQLGKIFR